VLFPAVGFAVPKEQSPKRLSNLGASQAQKRFGTSIEVVSETEDGDIDVAELERMIESSPKPKLVAVSHIATNSGVGLHGA
jgi:selenocysteine lyase/cysteine desulfurase